MQPSVTIMKNGWMRMIATSTRSRNKTSLSACPGTLAVAGRLVPTRHRAGRIMQIA